MSINDCYVGKLNNSNNIKDPNAMKMDEIEKKISEMKRFDEKRNYDYRNTLMWPEKSKGCKIPSKVPVPTCTYQWKGSYVMSTSSNNTDVRGVRIVYLNPFFMGSVQGLAKGTVKGIPVDQFDSRKPYLRPEYNVAVLRPFITPYGMTDGALRRIAPAWSGLPCNMDIPDVYERYRLVSASITISYTRKAVTEAQGIIGGGVLQLVDKYLGMYVNSVDAAAFNANVVQPNIFFDKLDDVFNMNLLYRQEGSLLDGLRMIYFPQDNSYEQFYKVLYDPSDIVYAGGMKGYNSSTDYYTYPMFKLKDGIRKDGFGWLIYIVEVGTTTKYFNLDYCFNYECIPKAELLNFIHVSVNPMPNLPIEVYRKIIEEVRGKCVQKINNLLINIK